MDLHAWITQQVDAVEASARAELEYRRVIIEPHDGGPAITGTVTGITQTADGLQLDIAQYGVEPRDGTPSHALKRWPSGCTASSPVRRPTGGPGSQDGPLVATPNAAPTSRRRP